MAFIPGFAYDIFLSYAHVDNLTALPEEEGWIRQFHRHLEVKLAKHFGRLDMVKIWWDKRRLDGGVCFDQTIQSAIEQSAIFLALTSRGYLKSEYCREELQAFYTKAKADPWGLTIENRPRILNLLLANIVYDNWPAEYPRTTGFAFYDNENKAGIGEPSDIRDKLFQSQLGDLIEAIDNILNIFQTNISTLQINVLPKNEDNGIIVEEMHSGNRNVASDTFIIYVADVADSLRMPRNRLIHELQQQGNEVRGNIPPPYEAASHEKEVIHVLSEADLSIHLFDNTVSRYIDIHSQESYPQKQLALSLAHGKHTIVWVPDNLQMLEVQEQTYNTFLNSLEESIQKQLGCHFVKGKYVSIASDIMNKVNTIKSQKILNEVDNTILLDFHFKDYGYASDVEHYLRKRGFHVLSSPDEDEPRSNLRIYEDRLLHAGSMMIFYGHVNEFWVCERIKTALQIILAENCPTKVIGIYVPIPKETITNWSMTLGEIQLYVIDNSKSDTFDPQVLHSFFVRSGVGAVR